MIIASTAHYGKFADTVLDAIGYEAENQTSQELLTFFKNLKFQPSMHEMLMEVSGKARIHKTVCDPNYSSIVEQIYQFAKSL